jgi:hypothetical protein
MSKSLNIFAAIAALGSTALMSVPADAATLLGCRSVGFIADTDVITVRGTGGPFRSIQLRVRGNEIDMRDLKVVYGNGQIDDLAVRSQIKAGSETRWIDLAGNRRNIAQIRMSYASKPSFKGLAEVCAFGR